MGKIYSRVETWRNSQDRWQQKLVADLTGGSPTTPFGDSLDLRLLPGKVHLRLLAQPAGRLLCGEVSLRVGQHLVTHHELFDGGGPQQRREVEGVELPVVAIVAAKLLKLTVDGK